MEHMTPSGLAVVERAVHHRADYVMYPEGLPPPEAQAWDGWPVGWTPPWSNYSPGLAQRVSTVFACIDLNARTLGTMPPYVTENGGTISPPIWLRNPEPELYTGWIEFMKLAVASFQLKGEVIIWATARWPDSGNLARFVILNPDWVNVEWVDGRRAYNLGSERLDPADVLHIRYSTWPGDARGHGPLEAAVRNLISAEALERYASGLASRGGAPWAVLKHPANLSADQATAFQNRWVEASSRRDGAPAVLSGGIELELLSLSPKDMALLELRQFDEGRICALLGVPPFLVGLPAGGDSMTYSNVSSLFDYHWRATLRPMASQLGEAISQWALRRGQSLEFNRDEYVRPGLAERAQAYSVLAAIVDPVSGEPAISVGEIRALERLSSTASAVALSGGG